MEAAQTARGSLTVLRRLAFGAALAVAAIAPGPASGSSPAPCRHPRCESAGGVLWSRRLPGQWITENGLVGTTPAHGQAYAALDGEVAVVGHGLTVEAYGAGAGQPLWTTTLAHFPAGASIVSVRAWNGVVTAGVSVPAAAGASGQGQGQGQQQAQQQGPRREEVVLQAATGRRIRAYPAAMFGGAVSAGPRATVVVGDRSVTAYANKTGRVLWSRPTGAAPQAWQKDGDQLYVTVSAGGYLGNAPVTALRQIDLRTGRERLVRAPRHAFDGTLGLAYDGVVVFTSARGATAYSGATGERLWHRDGTLPESVDVVTRSVYLLAGNVLTGVNPRTGQTLTRVSGAAAVASGGLYGVREGIVFGLDHGALGKAWGYDAAAGRVVWASAPLPWPHYFVDLSGIGGSTSPSQDAVLLAVCAQTGAPLADGARRCARPELVALSR